MLFALSSAWAFAQVTLVGVVTDRETGTVLPDAAVSINGQPLFATTDALGKFTIAGVPKGKQTVVVTHAGYQPLEQTVEVLPTVSNQLSITLTLVKDPITNPQTAPNKDATSGDIPTVTLDEADAETEGASEVANLLHANRDVFQSIAGFGWSVFRFRERGYESENFPLLLNGVNVNDPETGGAFFGEFGGLNDVMRSRETSIGLESADFSFGDLGGATQIDTRASLQRKQIRASYASSNRAYRNRVMLTMNTGLMPKGWAVSLSLSRRWAQEGWYEGTPFDGYSYFLSVDKKVKKHTFNLTFLGAPTIRGRNGDTFQEMIDLAGTTRYNPNWGYWNGEKRSSNLSHTHQPIGMLRWDWKPSLATSLTVSAYGQAGVRGSKRLDWYNAVNPSPDFNRRLPSALDNPELSKAWADALRNDQNLRQVDWAGIWESNSNNRFTVENADGIPGNSITGNRSTVLLADFREDSEEIGFNGIFRQKLSENTTLNAGANLMHYRGHNFKLVDDLLGGDYHLDVNTFAQRDVFGNTDALNNDIRTPNNVVYEGERFGWDYDERIRKGGAWAQVVTNLRKLTTFVGVNLNQTNFWRDGKMQNGRFPESSLGESEKAKFTTYAVKAGLTYKVNGRNYLYTNALYGTRAPLFRDLFLSPRTRNDFYTAAKPYGLTSGEIGIIHRSPQLRARATGYWTKFDDQIESLVLFGQITNTFGTEIRTGVDQIHSGIEAAVEVKPFPQWVVTGATNLGYYRYASRPSIYFYQDNTNAVVLDNVTAYQNNYLVPRTPQTTASAALKYEGRKFWFASLTFSFMDNMWFEFDRARRTGDYAIELAGAGIQPGSDVWNQVFNQTKAPSAFTVDLFAGKSIRIQRKYFLYLNVGVNNLLDNRSIILSGREAYFRAFQDADDLRLYSNELLYAPGINYFASISIRL